ncbi:class I SAM-dependent methyltransferase [Candidatus Parabeggiatoa sp. HSG14]|uniref:class I SAM-dependent methyltransferase n=1 Tax=Candidatus Parabeggiatoa sp. HSG14 TaxID=3055593 RepID=UPI0025A73E42|nr:class I SAM-dependent methyltransferase [Thiotrichales bacterium HSG14]
MSLIYKFPKLYDWVVEDMLNHPDMKDFYDNVFYDMLQLDKLQEGSLVLDLACGTGLVGLDIAERRPDVHVVGLDISDSVLEQARHYVHERQLKNIVFVKKDIFALTSENISEVCGIKDNRALFDMIVCSHGYTAMKNYEVVFEHTLSLLRKNGCYIIMDIYFPERSLKTRLANKLIAQKLFGADQFRKPWLLLKDRFIDFKMPETHVKYFSISNMLYVARGVNQQEN